MLIPAVVLFMMIFLTGTVTGRLCMQPSANVKLRNVLLFLLIRKIQGERAIRPCLAINRLLVLKFIFYLYTWRERAVAFSRLNSYNSLY